MLVKEEKRKPQNQMRIKVVPQLSMVMYGLVFFTLYATVFKQPSPRRAAYCIPHGPPPQLFVFKIATNLSTSASSYFA